MKRPRPSLATLVCLLSLALSSLALLGGCGCKQVPPPQNPLEDPAALRAAVDARIEQIEDARFKEVVLDYFGEGERVKVRQLILVKAPSFLRVQTRLPGSDEVLSLLVSDGDTFAMHKRDTNEYITGAATSQNIARLLPVDLSATDVARVMLGGAPWDRFENMGLEPTLAWDGCEGTYRYSARTRDGGELTAWVRHSDYAVVRVRQMDASQERVYEYTTDDWKRHGSVALPQYRRFVWPARDLDFSMDVGETQVNTGLPETLFELPPPAGSKVIRVDG